MKMKDQASVTREDAEFLVKSPTPTVAALARAYIALLDSQEQTVQQLAEWKKLGAETPHAMSFVLDASLESYRALQAKCEQLQADKERLDWLEWYIREGFKQKLVTKFERFGESDDQPLREAIDTARGVELAKEGTDAVAAD